MQRLVEALAVASGLVVVDNSMTVVARHLGAAMAALGDRQQAVAYTRQAVEVAEKVRFRPELALARLQLFRLRLTARWLQSWSPCIWSERSHRHALWFASAALDGI
jgi:hypothetical protein